MAVIAVDANFDELRIMSVKDGGMLMIDFDAMEVSDTGRSIERDGKTFNLFALHSFADVREQIGKGLAKNNKTFWWL